MTFTEPVTTCFRKYITFSGRASKAELWYFVLFLFLTSLAATIINSVIFGPEIIQQIKIKTVNGVTSDPVAVVKKQYNSGWLGTIWVVATLAPMLAATARRLHDSSKTAKRMLIPIAFFAFAFLMQNMFSELRPLDLSTLPKEIAQQYSEPPMVPYVTNNLAVFGSIALAFASVMVLIFWLTRPSTHDTNPYGPNPSEVPS